MKKKNTKLAKRLSQTAFVITGSLTAIGIIADIFGAADGITVHKDSLFGFINVIRLFLAYHWKWALLATGLLFITFLIIKWREKKKMRERLARDFSWFAAEQRNTVYSGGAEYLYRLKVFFKQNNVDFSWWAVTGVAGIGKTRLVIEALRDNEFSNADVQWIKEFDEYREDALKTRVDTILKSWNFRNIIIAEDAQIYMDNIGTFINYISGKSVDEIGDHKIRLLLLIRMGEDEDLTDRYRQLESKLFQSRSLNMNFKEFGNELKIEKYTESDIADVVKSYAVSTRKNLSQRKLTDEQIIDLQTKTIDTLL